ncbi:serine/threonine protein kinase [Paenibacillus pinistramenti]|uniref:serine/threonine protein kinase n=1 Tax=Paenibacillus pinistramenti TaxID=1768003 RepID=UPI00110818C7|nr:serine/threonine protein kinase [Paenibacillus pinistramenti]
MTTSTDLDLVPGTVIRGRWLGGSYRIHKLLGQGSNGVVYLVQQENSGRQYALKLGFDTVDLQSEINVLKTLHERGIRRSARDSASFLIEVDDAELAGRQVPFYIMRYVKGEPLSLFIFRRGADWLDLTGLNVLKQLARLHAAGFVFGDLKPDNIMAGGYGDVELIDYGGVSQMGRSVKQFTEWYDRGFWNAGSRTADAAYDWFSFSVVCIHLLCGDELKRAARSLPQMRTNQDLLKIVDNQPRLKPYAGWLKRGLTGHFEDSREACQYWERTVCRRPAARRSRKPTPGWLTGAFVVSVGLLGSALYLFFR